MHTHICESCFQFSNFDKLVLQNGGEFLIQANAQKGQKLQEDNTSTVYEHVEVGSLMN